DAQHAVGLHDLALGLEAHLGVDERAQELDGAAVLAAREGVLAALELDGGRRGRLDGAAPPRARRGRSGEERGGDGCGGGQGERHQLLVLSFPTWASRCPARTVSRSDVKASPESMAISISLLPSSEAKNGTSTSSPARASVAAPPRFGSRTMMRVPRGTS